MGYWSGAFAMNVDKQYNENDEMLVSVGENRKKWGVGETRVDNLSYYIAFELEFFCHECINFMSGHAIPSLLPFNLAAFGR